MAIITTGSWLEERSIPVPGSGCWIWIGATERNGYARIRSNGRRFLAHRLAYAETHGKIPDGMYVCHKCDTPSCVNPNHLFLGTPKDNVADMVSKGRKAPVDNENGSHKLKNTDVVSIRERYANSVVSQTQIAREYGVSQAQIYNVVKGKQRRVGGTCEALVGMARTHCKHGHVLDEANAYVNPKGRKECRPCRLAASRKFNKKEKSL